MGKSYNDICNNIINLLKIILYFDTYELQNIKNKTGGADAAPPTAVAPSDAAAAADNAEKSEDNNEAKEASNKSFLQIMKFFYDLIMGVLKWFGAKAASFGMWVLFASTAPIIPFFAVMAGMYGIIKYFMYKLRRL